MTAICNGTLGEVGLTAFRFVFVRELQTEGEDVKNFKGCLLAKAESCRFDVEVKSWKMSDTSSNKNMV